MTAEHKKIIMRYFRNYNQNKAKIKELEEDMKNRGLTPCYTKSGGRKQKGENTREKILVETIDRIGALQKWCDVFDKTRDAYRYLNDVDLQLIEWRFLKNKSVCQIVDGLYISEETYKRHLKKILDTADNWAEELGAYDV